MFAVSTSRSFGLACALALAACVADDGPLALPFADAERARELKFQQTPTSRTISQKQFEEEATARGRDVTDETVAYMHETYGRLGFFSADFDVRQVARIQTSFFTAYYTAKDKSITLIGSPSQELLVHELVHALQDQHFDLTALYDDSISSDETIALRGLVEGDAQMAEYRYGLSTRRREPARTLAGELDSDVARSASEKVLREVDGPAFFKAYPAFAYSYGLLYVAGLLEIEAGRWKTGAIDDMFRARGPSTAKAVMLRDETKGTAVPVGLDRLPSELAATHAVETVDRLGAWYSYLLFEPNAGTGQLPPSRPGGYERPDPFVSLVPAWRGDQLVVLREREGSASSQRQRAVMWTSDWGSAEKAEEAKARLAEVHRAVLEPDVGEHLYRAKDGELMWLGYVEGTLVLVKNLPAEAMEILARAAFESHEERLRILNPYARARRSTTVSLEPIGF